MSTIRTTLRHTIVGGSDALMMLTHDNTAFGISDQEVLDGITDWLNNFWIPAWQAVASTQAAMVAANVVGLNNDGTVNRIIGDIALNASGSSAGSILPAATSAMMFGTVARPNTRGTKYVPGMSEFETANGVIDAVALQNLVLLAIQYLTPIAVGTLSEMLPGILSTVSDSFLEFIGQGFVVDTPGYQRRRKPD